MTRSAAQHERLQTPAAPRHNPLHPHPASASLPAGSALAGLLKAHQCSLHPAPTWQLMAYHAPLHPFLAGSALAVLLEAHPNLLTYSVSADGKQLEKELARASVDVVERHGRKVAGVSYWREGASFETAPVSPLRPSV